MKKYILILLLFVFVFASSSEAAFLSDASGENFTFADNAALDFPDGDWSLSIWIQRDADTGLRSYVLDFDEFQLEVFIYGSGGGEGVMRFELDDDDTDAVGVSSSDTYFRSNTDWVHFYMQRSGDVFEMFLDGVSKGSTTNANQGASTFNISFYALNRHLSNSYQNGRSAEAALWDRTLTADERNALANGYSPNCFLNSMRWYVPMIREYVELKENIAITNNSTTVEPHPRIIYCQ